MEGKGKRGLRKGYTTGTCAAAAAKAAAIAFLTRKKVNKVEIALPLGKRVLLPVYNCTIEKDRAVASIIKDAGDDPDITNGAEIVCEFGVRSSEFGVKAFEFTVNSLQSTVFGGKGVGMVTKPGLAILVGEPAINPVPRKMIQEAVREAITNYELGITNLQSRISNRKSDFFITISIPQGAELSKKTMNARLGIIGGISILGTTGIVEPLSLSAYRHSIICAINVALSTGCKEIVFSTGRSSEKVAEKVLKLPQEAFILVGDHMGFALKEAGERLKVKGESKIILVGQFGKMSKLAAGHFETHCADSSIELDFLADMANQLKIKSAIMRDIRNANTARQVFFIMKPNESDSFFKLICEKAIDNAKRIVQSRIEIESVLVGYDNEIAARA